MKLTKFEYSSAIFFGILSLIISLLGGLVTYTVSRFGSYSAAYGSLDLKSLLFVGPVISGLAVYIYALVAICVYNLLAKKYPITWAVKK